MKLPASIACAALLLGGCVAPQRPVAARVGFIATATVDGATLGGIAGIAGCAVVGGGEHAPDKLLRTCAAVGAVAGGAATLYGAIQADDEPRLEHWIMVPILPAIYVIGAIGRLLP